MGKKTKTVGWALVMLCYSVALAGVSGWIGYKVASGRVEDAAPAARPQTFYATVSDIRDNAVTVTGMEVNDINFRGEFCFSVTDGNHMAVYGYFFRGSGGRRQCLHYIYRGGHGDVPGTDTGG